MAVIKFGTDGWRAVMAREFTFDNVAVVAQATADYLIEKGLDSKGMTIGYDARFLSEHFAQLIAEIMTANGIRVLLPDRDIPTPVTAYTIKDQNLGGAIMMTASHNPSQYNGIKFIPDYCHPALPDVTDAIERHIARILDNPNAIKKTPNLKLIEPYDPKPAYFKQLRKIINTDVISKANLSVWYDPLYATGRDYLDAFLKEIGVEVHCIKNERNPLFGGGLPDPNAYNLAELSRKVVENKASIGLSTDGDADRFGIVDSDGTYINANQTIVITFSHLLATRNPERKAIARSVATTHQVDAIAKVHGYKVIETPVGFKYIGKAILDEGAIMGGEESGGLTIYNHIPEKDGIAADLIVLEAVATTGKTCKQLLSEIAEKYGSYYSERVDLHVADDAKAKLVTLLRDTPPAKLGLSEVKQTRTIDGAQILCEDGSWALVRPSGTEPIIRCYGEAHSDEGLKAIHADIARIVQEIDPTASRQEH